ncbi:decapping and exoribonuclease protein Rai1-like [Arctopsyche grandis]|uniref:decapping and exoribonuclease protein Rai1-like n=1 Tax=Arctopsyche grandis TaxID=121162 RepID=UPI00406D9869
MAKLSTRFQDYSDSSNYEIKPELIGFYSVDGDQEYSEGLEGLKYLTQNAGEVEFDLRIGTDKAITKFKSNVGNETFFEYLKDHKTLLAEFADDDVMNAGIITNRSTLRNIADLFNDRRTITYSVTYMRRNIYVSKTQPRRIPSHEFTESTRWGHKFEQYMLTKNPNEKPNVNKPVNEKEEFVCIYKLKLGKHNILYRAETDGILANDDGDKGIAISDDKSEEDHVKELKTRTFVELKSSDIDITHPRFKELNSRLIWIQCTFAGINDIYIGLKNNGVVEKIKKYSLDDLKKSGTWTSDGIFKFCDHFFDFIKRHILEERDRRRRYERNDVIKLYFTKQPKQSLKLGYLPNSQIDDYIPEWYRKGERKTNRHLDIEEY